MCPIVVVTEDAPESITDVRAAVQTRRVIDRRPQRDRHANHPAGPL
jgi:hypothetical protein